MSAEPSPVQEHQPLLDDLAARLAPHPDAHDHHDGDDDDDDELAAQLREAVVHYQSISVVRHLPDGKKLGGTAQIIEQDVGGDEDFWSIQINLLWRPRTSSPAHSQEHSVDPIKTSIDECLGMRVCASATPACVFVYLLGGELLAHFSFPNGPDACMAFFATVKRLIDVRLVSDPAREGDLYFLEKRSRMRQAAPTLMNLNRTSLTDDDDDEFAALLQDLDLHSAVSTPDSRRRQRERRRRDQQSSSKDNVGFRVIAQFAKVTQACRELGDDISTALDNTKRQMKEQARERDRLARKRALDIYADIVASTDIEQELPPRMALDHRIGSPLMLETWQNAFGEQGKLKEPFIIKRAIFTGGVHDKARNDVWPYVLGLYPWESTAEQREQIFNNATEEYDQLKQGWLDLKEESEQANEESLANNPDMHRSVVTGRLSEKHAQFFKVYEQIHKDIVRTDRELPIFMGDDSRGVQMMGTLLNVYAFYNPEIAYCQGMSDLLSPLIFYFGVKQEHLTFACYKSIMTIMEANFRIDASGINSQLGMLKKLVKTANIDLFNYLNEADPEFTFAFRWILVRFKRALSYRQVCCLWERLWTGEKNLHVFVVLGLVLAHRRNLMNLPRGAYDCLTKYISEMTRRIDVDFAIREGELCYREYAHRVPWGEH